MSPTSNGYFDYSYETTPMEKVYAFDPVPAGMDSVQTCLILGGQANFWSHIDRTEARIDQQIYPRLIALSEALWSPLNSKNYRDFQNRLNQGKGWLNRSDVPTDHN